MTDVPALVLGIDGGGTKTLAWLATVDSTTGTYSTGTSASGTPENQHRLTVLGIGQAGPSNQRAVGIGAALRNLDQAISAAFANVQLPRQTVLSACLGLAGADRASDRSVIENWANECQLAERVVVVNDAFPLLYAGDQPSKECGYGVALICGTGSLAFGRGLDGRIARVGGWGYLFGDEGSAYAIGQSALKSVAHAADGRGPETLLMKAILDRLGIESPQQMVSAVYGAVDSRSAIAGLADVVFAVAEQDDACAVRILADAQQELGRLVSTLARCLELDRSLPLYLTGGILVNQSGFRQQLLHTVAESGIELTAVSIVAEPVAGAVRMAIQHLTGVEQPICKAGERIF